MKVIKNWKLGGRIVHRNAMGLLPEEAGFAAAQSMRHEALVVDEIRIHSWSLLPTREATEQGLIAWWTCTRCPARTLHDPETEDGFAVTAIVVYPPSCFEFDSVCGCPSRATGAVEHLDGCVAHQARVEAVLRHVAVEPHAYEQGAGSCRVCSDSSASTIHDVAHEGSAEGGAGSSPVRLTDERRRVKAIAAERWHPAHLFEGVETRRLEDGRIALSPQTRAIVVCSAEHRGSTCHLLQGHTEPHWAWIEGFGIMTWPAEAPAIDRADSESRGFCEVDCPECGVRADHGPCKGDTDPAPPSEELQEAIDEAEEAITVRYPVPSPATIERLFGSIVIGE